MLKIIFTSIFYIIEMLVAYIFFSKNYSKKYSAFKTILIGFVVFGIGCCIFFVAGNTGYGLIINLTVFFLLNFIYAKICFNISTKSAMIQSMALDALMLAGENFPTFILSNFLNVSFDIYIYNYYFYAIYGLLSKITYFILAIILSVFIKKESLSDINKKYFFPLFIFPFINLFILTMFLLLALEYNFSVVYQIVVSIINIASVFACLFLFVYYQRLIELEITNQKNETDKQILNILQRKNEQMHIMAHDYKNNLLTLSSMINSNDAKEYINTLIGEINKFSRKGKTQNKILDVILSKYTDICDEKHIAFKLDIFEDNLSQINQNDISSLFNNLLDNAVEAAELSKEKLITLELSKSLSAYHKITLVNSCDKEPISKNDKLISTKSDGVSHGYGTKSINNVVKKYKGTMNWEYNKTENLFKVVVLIPFEQ